MTNDAIHRRTAAPRTTSSGGPNAIPDAGDERERLAMRLDAVRKQRIADEAQGGQLPQLLRAIVRARRDRDSGLNRRLRAHRDHLERVMSDAEDLVFTVIEVNLFIHARGLQPSDPLVHEARKAVRRAGDAIEKLNRDLVGAG
jgi:hypothetical protein